MKVRIVPAGEYLPDQPSFGNSCITATNVIPWHNGYKKFQSFSPLTAAINARAQGFFVARDAMGSVYNFTGTASKLYQLTAGTTFSDVSRAVGGAYATPADGNWEFAQFGNLMMAVNGFDTNQSLSLSSGARFAAATGSPPIARHIAVIRDFVVLGNLSATQLPSRVQWSGINNAATWTPSLSTQSDFQDIPYGGWVQRIFGGEYGTVLMDSAVVRMTYVGSPIIFQFDVIERNRGLLAPMAAQQWGNTVFFLSEDGFYAIVGGRGAVPIGDGKVDKTFFNDLRADFDHRINCEIDPVQKIFYCHYPGSGSSNGTPNKLLAYNWTANKWAGPIEWEGDLLCRFSSVGYTLEQLDAINASLDALPFSLDSRAWMGGAQSLAGFNTAFRLGTFSGSAMAATVDTGEVELTPGRKSHVPYVRPLVDGEAVAVSVRSRNRLADSISTATAAAQSANGTCHTRAHSRYQSYRVTTSGEFNFIQGVEVAFDPGGLR